MEERAAALVELYVPAAYTPSSSLYLHFHHISNTVTFKNEANVAFPIQSCPN
jgi:hypothetical protein